MIIDTHCHYNLSPLLDNWREHWQKSQAQGIVQSIVVGASLASSQQSLVIAKQAPNLYAAIGIHPDECQSPDIDQQLATIRNLAAAKNDKLIAIGEIGLDYFRLADSPRPTDTIQKQQQLFQSQLALANQLQLPAIIHVRDQAIPETPTTGNAFWDALQLIKAHYQLHRPFILHCVFGPLNYIQQAVALGAYIGVAGNVTYKNAHHLREIVKLVPADRLLIETDAPFLPPVPYRGQICEPWMITETAQYLLTNLGVELDQLVKNSRACFQLPS